VNALRDITVTYHHDPPFGWWFASDDIPGWTGAGASLLEAYKLAGEGVPFALETHAVRVTHRLADDVPTPSSGSADIGSEVPVADLWPASQLEAVGFEPRAEVLRVPVAG